MTSSLYTNEPQTLALIGCYLLAGYLTYRCLVHPNPAPKTPYSNDRLGSWIIKQDILSTRQSINVIIWIYHAFLAFTFPNPPLLLCPQLQNLNDTVFTWNSYVILCLSLIVIAASIRLLAFAHLGENFTFRLAKPKKLIMMGLYAYVQHPSYSANLVVFFANVMLLLRVDGMMACWLPSWVVQWRGAELAETVGMAVLLGFSCWGLAIRVKDEEEMLRKEFGKKWEDYHHKTKRFVPGLF